MKTRFLLIACFFISTLTFAQNEGGEPVEMDTDRPSVGDASKVVPPGTVQIEAGFYYESDKTNFIEEKELHYPDVLIRVGVLKFAELRLRGRLKHVSLAPAEDQFPWEISQTGLDDIMAGTKIQLWQGNGVLPTAALQADFRLPAGNKYFKSEKVEPKLRLNFRNKLSEKLSLSYNLGVEWEENENPAEKKTFNHIGLYSLALNYKITDNFKVFVEPFAEFRENDMQQSIDAGLAYNIKPNLQVDLYSGVGLSEEAPDFFVSAGISFRLPK
ncbi:transporter [Adhaeribacter soli]|uniref:Transporter n=1 Tax=Adhaeribacter soli TaxID=2607655 RepID=A0A5N1IRY0_9BACT|nr:transporter [Adhaeribacter soli]KAA9332804.1 transporter [Adhaeribacter soli]